MKEKRLVKSEKRNQTLALLEMLLIISLAFTVSFSVSAQEVYADTVCCEKTIDNQYCQTVDSSLCAQGAARAPTSCEQTSFCKSGCCAGVGGYCYNNYPKALCEKQYRGSYSEDPNCGVAECKTGCCVIGTQASLLTKNRCVEETSKFPDLEVDFREGIQDEASCVDIARTTEKGCCVKDNGCSYGAKSECTVATSVNGTGFYKDKFCSGLQGLCDCAPADKLTGGKGNTMCLPNDDSVYWKDSCGNAEGVKEKCDYNQGTLCGDSDKDGVFTCESLKCEGQGVSKDRSNKLSVNLENYHGTNPAELKTNELLNGESWCQADSREQDDNLLFGRDPVGSRYYRSLCINGQELIEPCKDFRQEFCYSASVEVPSKDERGNALRGGKYTEARCLKNEWQSCIDSCNTADSFTMGEREYKEAVEKDLQCCEDRTKRDCRWTGNKCVPAVSPGAKFWEGEGSDVCGKANLECTAFFVCGGWNRLFGLCETGGEEAGAGAAVSGAGAAGAAIGAGIATGGAIIPIALSAALAATLIGLKEGTKGGSGWKLVHGEECFSQDYLQASNNLCRSFGDCGTDYNYLIDDDKVPTNLKLTKYGFSNTEFTDGELAGAVKDKVSEGIHNKLKYKYGKEKDEVPGNLSDNPKWEEGKTFLNFGTVDKKGRTSKYLRALYFGQEEGELGNHIYGSAVPLVGSIGLGLLAGTWVKQGFLTSLGVGLGATPHGLLIRGIFGAIFEGGEAVFGKGVTGIVSEAGVNNNLQNIAVSKAREAGLAETQEEAAKLVAEQGAETIIKETAQSAAQTALTSAETQLTTVATEHGANLAKEAIYKATQNAFTPGNAQTVTASIEAVKARTLQSAQTFGEAAKQSAEKVFNDVLVKTSPPSVSKDVAGQEVYKLVGAGDVSATRAAQSGDAFKAADSGLTVAKTNAKTAGDTAVNAAKEAGKKTTLTGAQVLTAINAAMWAYSIYQLGDTLLEKTQTQTIKTTCQPWQAPAVKIEQKDQCERCNPGYGDYLSNDKTPKDVRALKACSEYRCKSLGASCDLINKGTEEEQCISLSKYDVNSPVIKPWKEGFSKELKDKIKETNTGFKIEGEIPIYERFVTGLQTDEPAQCKMSFQHSKRYNEMENIYFMSNTFKYFHAQEMFYPASKNITNEGLKLTGGGDYKVYVRCQDAVGNVNEKDYVLEFKIAKEPDLTAPTIIGTSIGKDTYLTHGTDQVDLTLFVNEPAECKWSLTPLDYSGMQETNKCVASRLNSLGLYECQYAGSGVGGSIGPAITGIKSKAGETKFAYFKCQDKSEKKNFNKEAFRVILKGSDPLRIDNSSIEPKGVIKTSKDQANITLKLATVGGAELNGRALCKYTQQESLKENLAAMTPFLNTNSSVHTQPWEPPTGRQEIFIGCHDIAGNANFTKIEFTIEQDVTPPKIVKVYNDEGLQPPLFTVEISEKATCKDSTEGTFEYETNGNLMTRDGNVHRTSTPGSNLYYVLCKDEFGNLMEPARVQFA